MWRRSASVGIVADMVLAAPAISSGEGSQEDRDHVGPTPRFRYRLQTELSAKDVQVPFFRDDEDVVGSNDQTIRDQLNRHRRVPRQDFVQLGSDGPQVIDDNDRHPHVDRQMSQEPGIGIKPASRSTDANNRKVVGDIRHYAALPCLPGRIIEENGRRRDESVVLTLAEYTPPAT